MGKVFKYISDEADQLTLAPATAALTNQNRRTTTASG